MRLKKTIFILLLFSCSNLYAQQTNIDSTSLIKKTRLFFDYGIGVSNQLGILNHIGFTYIHSEKAGLAIGVEPYIIPSISSLEVMISPYLRYVMVFPIKNESKKLQVEFGLSYSQYITHQVFSSKEPETQSTIGFPFKISLLKPTRKFIGTNLAIVGNINKINSYIGIEFDFLRIGK